MGSPTTPTHGKFGALYVLRPNGFNGIGLNDLTWGVGSTAADATYYEVEIDHTAASPDSFRWRVNGGGWTENVDITGAEQTLADGQKLTFGAIDGHTVADKWTIGNLKNEATTESGATAQITDTANLILNPNAPPVWTDSGGKVVTSVNYTNGKASFNGNVTTVTVTGNNGYVPTSALQKVAYLKDWSLSLSLDMADSSSMGDSWKTALPGLAGGTGAASSWFIANKSLLNCLQESIAAGDKYFFVQLFNWDAAQDQTGDHINAWVTFTSFNTNVAINAVVPEAVNFQVYGEISFTADV